MRTLVLASSSRYRRDALANLGIGFSTDAPEVDEAPRPGEAPEALAMRLALAKAQAVADRHPGALVIGSDQVAHLEGRLLGKPGTPARAAEQLRAASGRCVEFLTAVCLVGAPGRAPATHLDRTSVHFRTLTDPEITRYLSADEPWDCAGAFRCERLGIALFDRVNSDDPTALVGIPLIAVARMLRESGLDVP
jgi:septum formation protein